MDGQRWKNGGGPRMSRGCEGRDTGIGGRAVEQRCADGVVVEQGRKNGLV